MARRLLPVDAIRSGTSGEQDFDLRRLPFVVHVHFDAFGTQQVILKSPAFHIVLIVSGPLVTMGPASLRFSTTGLKGLTRHIDALDALAHLLLDRKRAGALDCPAPVDRLRLRNAIIALDGERSGASRRDIATVIYGAQRVAADWRDASGSLRAAIKRDALRGRRYVAGDYRQLVAGGTFAAATR